MEAFGSAGNNISIKKAGNNQKFKNTRKQKVPKPIKLLAVT